MRLSQVCLSLQINDELKQSLKETMTQKYKQPREEKVTNAVDKLQQEVRPYLFPKGPFTLDNFGHVLCTAGKRM